MIRFLTMLASSLWVTLAVILTTALAAIVCAMFLLGMSAAGAFAFYFVVWWIVLFVTLPVAIRSQSEVPDLIVAGTEPGAPVAPHMRERAILTTFLADIVFFVSVLFLPLAGL